MRIRLLIALLVLLGANGGCRGGSRPIGLIEQRDRPPL